MFFHYLFLCVFSTTWAYTDALKCLENAGKSDNDDEGYRIEAPDISPEELLQQKGKVQEVEVDQGFCMSTFDRRAGDVHLKPLEKLNPFCGENGKECWNGKCVEDEEDKICICNTKNCNCDCQCKPKPTDPPSSGTDSGGKLSRFLIVITFILVINNH